MRRFFTMFALVMAGEAIFGLPFLVARIFRPTLLDVFGITNLQLGTAFSVYGVVAMLAYFPGGALADRFTARKMMAAALVVSALGGIYYATVPSIGGLKLLFGFWGVTTILLFWAAMIRATRVWGGTRGQGKAFGILDGGRGLLAALLASATVAVFGALLPEDAASATLEQRAAALKQVIWIFTVMTVFAAAVIWFCVPNEGEQPASSEGDGLSWSSIKTVLKNPAVWLQGMIVVTAYTGYKGMDNLSLFARDVFAFDDVRAAHVSALAFWVRPFAALGAGLLADKVGGPRTIAACFVLIMLGDGVVALGLLDPTAPWMLFTMVISISAAVFGLRGIYFAIFDEAGVPAALTGTAVGVVSVVGYTPDIFIGPINGYLTDTYPGATGHEYFFAVLAGFATLGLICSLVFQRLSAQRAA
ncbi:MAG: MFS transporter [Deltaproteobacteria bacterium]|nr:MFS transporter [Deltaproteobacteria bacterium]